MNIHLSLRSDERDFPLFLAHSNKEAKQVLMPKNVTIIPFVTLRLKNGEKKKIKNEGK